MTGGGHSGEGSLKLFKLGSVGKLRRANPLHFYTTSLHSTIQDFDGTQLSEKVLFWTLSSVVILKIMMMGKVQKRKIVSLNLSTCS